MAVEERYTTLHRGQSVARVTAQITGITLRKASPGWYVGLGGAVLLLSVFIVAIGYLFWAGVGIWGINRPVAWGFAITNFIWWIGIGHAGTFISAFLFLLRQKWRTSIFRFAEAMTVFALSIAGLFPILHLGRPWLFYWFVPYPNSRELWPEFISPLIWDFFAILTYFTVSLLILYIGMIPDLATLRDRTPSKWGRKIYGALALGWSGSGRHWWYYQSTYFLLVALVTPLVIAVHSIVGLDFAVSNVTGWHHTISPPFFVAGAIFSGLAMVIVLAAVLRSVYGLGNLVTPRHLDNLAKLLLATSLLVTYGYLMEIFGGWYSGSVHEQTAVLDRFFGPYAGIYWSMWVCNFLAPQLFWFRRLRYNVPVLVAVSLVVLVGMWLERFMVVIGGSHFRYLTPTWDIFVPTVWDWALLAGSFGLFLTLMFLFVRFLPIVAVSEINELITEHEDGA